MRANPFRALSTFNDAFVAGLVRQRDDGGLGALILALANATLESALWERMRCGLARHFAAQRRDIRARLRAGEAVSASVDDLLVFLKLMVMGFDGLGVNEYRYPGVWELQYNPVRGLRPARMAEEEATEIHVPYDPRCFNFNQPYLTPEIFWRGDLEGRELCCLYNKFPFLHCHLLLVPDPAARRPQYLDREMLEYVWRVLETIGPVLPGFGAGYNSYGACASVNHLHFQGFLREEAFPVELDCWRHNGGTRPYPAVCEVARNADDAWRLVEAAHGAGRAYNMILRPGVLYLLPRLRQGSYAAVDWTAGHAWYEMGGGVVLARHALFESLEGDTIAAGLARVGRPYGAADSETAAG